MTKSIPVRSLLLALLLPRLLVAQGITSAAIQGRVTTADGTPIRGATIGVVNLSNGHRWEATTRPTGTFLFENVGVGGPYRIDARAVGFASHARTGIVLALGQRLVADVELRPIPVVLAPVVVTASTDPVLNSSRTGPAEIVSRERIRQLPNVSRDFLALTTLSPQVAISPSSGSANTGGITIGGQNRLYNSFQIDGGVNHDLYRGRLPGRETLPRPISLEALEEIQVLAAPFDVRYGAAAGGLVNAVTRSGTNTLQGSMFGYLTDAAVVGRSATGEAVNDFTTWQFGGTVSGPIVRDRAHYFLSVDVQHEVVPDPGPLITDTVGGADLARIGISYASAVRFQTILRDSFQLEPGHLGPVNGQLRSRDVFGKIAVQLGTNSHLELSHHSTHGDRWGFIPRVRTFYRPSAFDQRNPSRIDASRLTWNGRLGHRWSNELIVSRLRLNDACRPMATFPLIRVRADQGQLQVGAGGGCPIHPVNSVIQDALEVTENVTGAFGAHVVTIGARGEALHFQDDWLQNSSGIWSFASLDQLETRGARTYERTLPGPERIDGPDFRARQLSLYMQDRWTPTRRLALTIGLRLDVSMLPDAATTNALLDTALGIDTGRLPRGDALWSPRVGINYQLGARRRTFLRGGVGLFNGPPPYTWLGNAYRETGMQELFLSCGVGSAPVFDLVVPPVACANGRGPVALVSFFDPDVRYPQNLKLALGVDHELPGGVVGTVDVLYTRAMNQLYLTDANLQPAVGVARGEGNRFLYGTIVGTTSSFTATPARRDTRFGQVVRVANGSGDHALSLSAQLRKRFGDRGEASALYAITRARDRMSLVSPFARLNLQHTPLDGTLEDRPLRTSYFEIPHRVQVSATVQLPFQAQLALVYAAASGTPYTYVMEGDANADGIQRDMFANDIFYVPLNRADISIDGDVNGPGLGTVAQQDSAYDSLDAYIRAEPCVDGQRGRIMKRNSCRNPWFGTLNARLRKAIPTTAGQSLELTAEMYNVLNLLSSRWGQSRVTIPDPWVPMVRLVGWDASGERGVYQPAFRQLRTIQDFESRWRAQLGVRYVF